MADKENKQKPTEAKSSTEATKVTQKATAKKPTEAKSKSASKPTAESVVGKYTNTRGKQTTVVADIKKRKTDKSKQSGAASAAKTTKAQATASKPTAESVVDKYSNTRGKQTGIVEEMKQRKVADEEKARATAKEKKAQKAAQARVAAATAGEAAAPRIDVKTQNILLWILIGILVASLLAGVILFVVSAVTNSNTPYVYAYSSAQEVGYYAQQVGTTKRVKPITEVRNEGLAENYPVYGSTLRSVLGDDNASKRDDLVAEACYLTPYGTWNGYNDRFENSYVNNANKNYSWMTYGKYTWMDQNGLLYSGSTANPVAATDRSGKQRQLYEHTSAAGMYGGDVDANEPGIIKEVTMRFRGYDSGYGVTGVYAPAGEVIKIELSKADMEATGGIVIHIGQALYNGKANDIWTAKNAMNRMPVIMSTWTINKNTSTYDESTETYTAYVGSHFGGPVYIRNERATFTAKIYGAVAYQHFILGYTTPEEFEQSSKSSAPYFDLEVWSYGVLHSGPKRQAKAFSYDDLYKVAVLWEKVALVSTTNRQQGIVFLYDPFVAAGAAVAFPGQGSVNCPEGWMSGALNYNAIVAGGSWGNFHEYHHNFQGYGVGNGGEVTNNGMTLVSYALFTKISSARGISNFGAAGMGGWNRYTSATWALQQNLGGNPENGQSGLALYATLLHNFGADNYIQAKVKQQRTGAYGENPSGYMQAWQDVTHYDMSYFFSDILGFQETASLGNDAYSMFVPVSSVYQTGRGIKNSNGDTEYIKTMQPYVISYGENFVIDLRQYSAPGGQYKQGSIVLPDGFTYTIKNVSQPENGGKITETDTPGVYTYSPNANNLQSGKIIVTLGITKNDNAFKVEDVDLVLEFEQTHENTKSVLERTTYTFSSGKMYTDAVQAFNNNFDGYESTTTINHTNPTQNCNTDVWLVADNEEGHNKFPDSTDEHFVKDNTIIVVSGKLFAENEGRYRIYLRGRMNCAVFYSIDGGKTYQLGAAIKDETVPQNSAYFRPNDSSTYFDLDLSKDSWVYFKEVLIVQSSPMISFIGLGMKQWTEPMFTIQTTTDANGKEITKYFNHLGVEVSEAEANNTELIPPTIGNNTQPYVNAYRTTYEAIKGDYTTDYYYVRYYSYDFKDNELQSGEQKLVDTNYAAGYSWNWSLYPGENLTDGNKNTIIHTKNGWGTSESKPMQFVIDLGEEKCVNRMILYTQYRPNGDYHAAKTFKLEGSVDGEVFNLIGEFENIPRVNLTTTVNFDDTTIRYYRLTVTGSTGGLLIISDIEMWHAFEVNGAKKLSPFNKQFAFYGNWQVRQTPSSYGQVLVGSRGSSVKFEFEGTRIGILSSAQFGANLEVIIDGKVADCVDLLKPLDEQSGDTRMSFLSDLLSEGKHTVVIKCKGEVSFDSFALYPNPPAEQSK